MRMTTVPEQQALVRRWRPYLIRLLGFGLLAAVLWSVDLASVADAVTGIAPRDLLGATALCLGLLGAKALRWLFLLRALDIRQSLAESIAVYSDAVFWGTITPGRLGEFKRIFYLTNERHLSIYRSTVLCLLDRGLDLISVLALVFAVSAFAPSLLGDVVPRWPFLALLGAGITGLALRRPIVRLLRRAASRWIAAKPLLEEATQDLLVLSDRRLTLLIALSVASFAQYVLMVWVLSFGLPFSLELHVIALCVGLTMLAGLLPISYFNLGPREVVLIALFTGFGLSREDAISFSFLFLISYLILMFSSVTLARVGRWLTAATLSGSR